MGTATRSCGQKNHQQDASRCVASGLVLARPGRSPAAGPKPRPTGVKEKGGIWEKLPINKTDIYCELPVMIRRVIAVVVACFATLALAQEGHPLSGTWHGEWSSAAGQKTRIVMALKWDTRNVVGTLNPGPRSAPFKEVTLDPEKWMVHFEADAKDKTGNPVHVVADGKLENLGSYNRTVTGTWTQGTEKGEFKITRD
jgi:hypothetical protein